MKRSMNIDLARRRVLRWMGTRLPLPLLAGIEAKRAQAAEAPRKRFIGVFFPSGAYMPGGVDGRWNFDEALTPLVPWKSNTMLLRGLYNGFPGRDPHWQNAAGFLSCNLIQIGDPGVARCGKTLDQHLADAQPTPLRSLDIGGLYYHVHPLNDHPGYSNDYLNRISWQSADKSRTPLADPRQLFEKLFTVDAGGAALVAYQQRRRKSILDHLHKDATALSRRLPASYRPVLESYMGTVREVEVELGNTTRPACASPIAGPTADFTKPDKNFVLRYELHQQMIVAAMQCGLVNVATIMYAPSSTGVALSESVGPGPGNHSCAHHGGSASLIDRQTAQNRVFNGLLAHLLGRLKAAGLLGSTLVLYGSDMSDGDKHIAENLPMLLCGEGSDLKFGQELGAAATKRPLSDLHLSLFPLFGVQTVKSYGEGRCASTGPLPIVV